MFCGVFGLEEIRHFCFLLAFSYSSLTPNETIQLSHLFCLKCLVEFFSKFPCHRHLLYLRRFQTCCLPFHDFSAQCLGPGKSHQLWDTNLPPLPQHRLLRHPRQHGCHAHSQVFPLRHQCRLGGLSHHLSILQRARPVFISENCILFHFYVFGNTQFLHSSALAIVDVVDPALGLLIQFKYSCQIANSTKNLSFCGLRRFFVRKFVENRFKETHFLICVDILRCLNSVSKSISFVIHLVRYYEFVFRLITFGVSSSRLPSGSAFRCFHVDYLLVLPWSTQKTNLLI